MKKMFRLLKANEIEVRANTVNEKGATFLLYKDARVDQRILDETVGPMNWQRRHPAESNNANCIVSIWDNDKKMWVEKEDTGTESFTEKEKGLASDSFKRACFNWGIGRELYTSPFIWVGADKVSIQKKGEKFSCYDKLRVTDISYDENDSIESLVIVNEKTGEIVFQKGEASKSAPKPTKKTSKSKSPTKTEDVVKESKEESASSKEISFAEASEYRLKTECRRAGQSLAEILADNGEKFLNNMLANADSERINKEDMPYVRAFVSGMSA